MIILVLIVVVLTKQIAGGLFVGIVLVILGGTLLFRTAYDGQHFQHRLFWSYEVWESQRSQVIANVFMFIPVGLVAGSLWKWKGIIAGFALSITIELLQLISRRGLFEFDDILHNTLGTLIGVSLYMIIRARK